LSVENKIKQFKNKEKQEKFKIRNKRIRFKDEIDQSNLIEGKLIATIGSISLVKCDGVTYECQVAGIIKSKYSDSSIVAVGDNVKIEIYDEFSKSSGYQKGTIREVGNRFSKLSRISPQNKNMEHVIGANSDMMLIFMAADNPKYNRRLIDRYLVAAKCGDLTPIIVINKSELGDEETIYEDLYTYTDELGIELFLISLQEKINLDTIELILKDKRTIISGPSGSGKSTFINHLLNNEVQEVGIVSLRTAKGLHTTSFVRMFELPFGGEIIDSPGIREFALWDIDKYELPTYFDDFIEYHHNCKFLPCSHTHEPGCAVLAAVEEGDIDADRYESYLLLLESLE
jgi:ribosome biogenesis GTPase